VQPINGCAGDLGHAAVIRLPGHTSRYAHGVTLTNISSDHARHRPEKRRAPMAKSPGSMIQDRYKMIARLLAEISALAGNLNTGCAMLAAISSG